MKRTWILGTLAAVVAGVCVQAVQAGPIPYVEDFALAADRQAALAQLVPGTEEYYYFHCLHYQNTGQADKLKEMLGLWTRRFGRTAGVVEIEHRQALLSYRQDPQATLSYLRNKLALHFNHQRELMDAKSSLPTVLDQNRITAEAYLQHALALHQGTADGMGPGGLWLLAQKDVSGEVRRRLLGKLTRPDLPNLVRLILDDLDFRGSRPFGSMAIHGALTLEQLEQCVKLKGDLLNQQAFVTIYLRKLLPTDDENWRHDPAAKKAYLERLWAFADRLAPVNNSLKAHVLYHRLDFDRRQGVYDKQRFMEYVKLPRPMGYVEPRYMADETNRRYAVDMNAAFDGATLLEPIRIDDALVRDYLMHFFQEEDGYQPYAPYIRDTYLREVLAETKILAGIGDVEEWASMLSPAKFQALKERVDLDLALTNHEQFGRDDAVALDIDVKNVTTLLVKVYRINALNYYRDQQRELNTDLNLDGLVAGREQVVTYEDLPLRRQRRRFEFASIDAPGVYVIDFIGNGVASRALVRKGKLHYVSRVGTAGVALTVLDEANRQVNDAAVWLAGHRYTADKNGEVALPFSTAPGEGKIVLTAPDGQGDVLATLANLHLPGETYQLRAGFHVEREQLLTRKKPPTAAKLLIRPMLDVNGTPVTLSVLSELKLVITSTDLDGVATAKEVKAFIAGSEAEAPQRGAVALYEDRTAEYEFAVPDRLAQLEFALHAKVELLSTGKKIDLADGAGFRLNDVDRTAQVEDLHLARIQGRYVLEVRGHNGEPRVDRPVNLQIKHRDFTDSLHVSLQTDDAGRVQLGELKDIEWVQAATADGVTQAHTWPLVADRRSQWGEINAPAGQTVRVPYVGPAERPTREEFSLFDLRTVAGRNETYVVDRFDALALEDGFLELRGLPAGDYELLIKSSDTQVRVRLTEGEVRHEAVLGTYRRLGVRNLDALQIVEVRPDGEAVRIRLANATPFARVAVIATRYLPGYSAYGNLHLPSQTALEVGYVAPPLSAYVSGRNIGDEYRYILDRKLAEKRPGNMLERPGLLLNPWAIRKTEAGRQEAAAGEAFRPAATPAMDRAMSRLSRTRQEQEARPGSFADLDFLAEPAVVLANLQPDADGVVRVPRAALEGHQQVHVVAIDPHNTVYREVSLAESELKLADLRLRSALDGEKHFSEQKRISQAGPDKPLVLEDVSTSSFEAYDSLARVYALYMTLSHDPTLGEFGFLLEWPSFTEAQKREKYSKYACHELNFFLLHKDPAFYQAVVAPYLKNKKDKTYLDLWQVAAGEQVEPYRQPWKFGQLNIVERVLLAQRLPAEQERIGRYMKEQYDLIPPDIDRWNFLFATALKGSALETDSTLALGFEHAKQLAEEERLEGAFAADSISRGPAGAGMAGRARFAGPPSAASPATQPPAPSRVLADEATNGVVVREVTSSALKADAREYFARDANGRDEYRRLYQALDKTEEWAENNYYHLPIEAQNAGLIPVNAFWRDYAAYTQAGADGPFVSVNLAEATANFTEMMLALAVLDLPLSAGQVGEHQSQYKDRRFTLTPAGPMVVYHKEIRPAEPAAEKMPILVSQNFFRHGDRYRYVNNERLDKYVTDEFLVHVVYGGLVVITNPTSSPRKLDVLLQVPQGAVPVLASHYTRSVHVDLQPYNTQTLEYYFYFPQAGQWPHYPVQVAREGELVGYAEPVAFNAVARLSKIDTGSWDYVSQHAEPAQTLAFLRDNNVHRLNLDRIAWRMRDPAFFDAAVALLAERHAYTGTLWSYGLYHDRPAAIGEYLQHADAFVRECGLYLDSPLLKIDPVIRKSYQHLEYSPLVNARAHQLGRRREIVNQRLLEQYAMLMKVLSYRPTLDDGDLMAVTYYLLLQDRVDEARQFFARVEPARLAERLQYDYFLAYVQFYADPAGEALQLARRIAEGYKDHGVDRWRKKFQEVLAQIEEIEAHGRAAATAAVDRESRQQEQTRLAATEPSLDFTVEARQVTLKYQNLKSVQVNYYLMDVELLFSRNPFVQEYSSQFSYIRPNDTRTVELPEGRQSVSFELPERLANRNVLVEVVAAGVRKQQPYFSNSLAVQTVENYGQVRVTHAETGRPLAAVYVKAYARMKDGRVVFYKDGYTDLRGRFDYVSLNTDELERVERFSLLILSETDGAVIREAAPPKQ